MTLPQKTLSDNVARREAMAVHDRCFLVEAGAGSGKTAVMAGRIALLLARGIAPRFIAAVTFTEFGASELFIRVRTIVDALAAGEIPTELGVALPDGLTEGQRQRLTAARGAIDEMTCSTIHGFCQRLITPYPVEADIDPGAAVMDRDQADLAFNEIVDGWLRTALGGQADDLLTELVLHDPGRAVRLIHTVLAQLRRQRAFADAERVDLSPLAAEFLEAVGAFAAFTANVEFEEPETTVIAARFQELAEAVQPSPPAETPAQLVRLLTAEPHPDLYTQLRTFRKYQKKGKWKGAASRAGLSQVDADRMNERANAHYGRCCETWTNVQQAAAGRALADLLRLLQPVMERFREYKRLAGLLDFDDLIFAARDLLRDHEAVRRALGRRFTHVLVDEFQDTDPLQTEIFWRLCGDPSSGADNSDWTNFALRPGALFLVGDPKQAIYRFRGADIAAYLRAREAFSSQAADGVLSIATNFRSCEPIMRYVNERFEQPLTRENGQPGFQALDAFRPERASGPSVVALDVRAAGEDGKAKVERQRDSEAETVAALCARLIGTELVLDPKCGQLCPCKPGDIALLAPTGSDLWRYEEALEKYGIPVATQAGKGLFKRQEIQDLIAVTRVLADPRDTLALGALLRGPLVGLTEEELLDIVWALPRHDNAPDDLPLLDISVKPETIVNPLARDIMERLRALRRKANTTTPHHLLSQAVDSLHVRSVLLQRHGGRAERALANVDLYLNFSRAYAVRGLRAFSDAMTAAWTDESRAVEGRPDAQEEAVALYTMHAAKGLEWPIVVPVNTMTQARGVDSAVTDRASGRFYCPVFGVEPSGYNRVREAEQLELDRERVRLWYVAATRAREVLILPRLDVAAGSSAWTSVIDLALPTLPALDPCDFRAEFGEVEAGVENTQTRSLFESEAAAIEAQQLSIVWHTPSRDEGAAQTGPQDGELLPLFTDEDAELAEGGPLPAVQGGRERGRVLHKLLEEVLTGETVETMTDISARAETLIRTVGQPVTEHAALGLSPAELAGCVLRAFSIPEVAALRPRLQPEFHVYASDLSGTVEEATSGIADAIAFGPDGTPEVVIDWKSDVELSPDTVQRYCAQVRAYLDATGAARGMVVAVTSGRVIPVSASGALNG